MGKGDRKTRKGKIWMGSYGVSRPRPSNKETIAEDRPAKKAKTPAAKQEQTTAKKSTKKATAKKSTTKKEE